MYEAYYGLSANPFRLAPDPRFFYESGCHKRGLAYLRYGLEQGQGFVVVTGIPGTGKSLLVQTIFAEISGRRMVVSGINNTNLEADDMLRAVANSFDVYCRDSSKAALLNALERFLIEKNRQGKHVLLIVDEAQNLPKKSIEELRMLSNFQIGDQPLIQIMLLGQQQLQQILADPGMEQLTQRVIASCHLRPLEPAETRGYIEHRLRHVGWQGNPSFSGEALEMIHHVTHGIPRLINTFCDRLLLAAFLDEKQQVDAAHLQLVLKELQNEATGAWQGVSLKDVVKLGLPPLPDGEFVVESRAVVKAVPLSGKTKEARSAPQAVPEPVRSFNSKIHGADGGATVVPLSKPHRQKINNRVALSGSQVTALAQHSLQDEEKSIATESANQTPEPEAEPLACMANDESADANGNSLSEPQRTVAEYEPSPVVCEEPGARVERFWWLVIGVLAVIALAVVLLMIFMGGSSKTVRTDIETESVALLQVEQELASAPAAVAEAEEPLPLESVPVETPQTQGNGSEAAVTAEKPVPPAEVRRMAKMMNVAAQQPQAPVPQSVKPVKVSPVVESAPEKTASAVAAPLEAVPAPLSESRPEQTAMSAAEAPEPPPRPLLRAPVAGGEPPKSQVDNAQIAGAASKPSIADMDLPRLINDFVFAYESGDLNHLLELFAENAVADDSAGRKRIARDYRELFHATDIRRMNIGNITWKPEGDAARGSGEFEVTVWRRGDDKPSTIKGRLNIEVSKEDKHLVIRRLAHVVSR